MRSTRRRAMQVGFAAAAVCCGSAQAEPGATSLDEVARLSGRRFGAAIADNAQGGIDNPRYSKLAAAQCGVVVPENAMKWQALQPSPGAYRFEAADRIVAWALHNGVAVRGHNLLWQNSRWLPDWVNSYEFGSRPATAAEKLIVDHVTTVCRHFGDGLTSWDVVNETIDPATGRMRETVLTRALGDQVVDIAFHAARQALPRMRLVYNDYMGWGAGDGAHRAGVLRLLERLKRAGAPVDALGLQSHLGGDSDTLSAPSAQRLRAWRAFLQEAVGLGLGLLVTELDVNDRAAPGGDARRDAAVAACTRDYLDLTLSFPQVSDVLCWGLVDRFSWLQREPPRADGLLRGPLPFGDAYAPKAMAIAIAAALAAASPRRAGTSA